MAIDLVSTVKELHVFNSNELNNFLKGSENLIFQHDIQNGPGLQVDMEKVARFLPLHLIAVMISSDRDATLFGYLLCGIRLLYSICSLAHQQPKLEQILLDDVKVSEQLLDLVTFLLVVLGGYMRNNNASAITPLLHSALVPCSLYLLTECISSQWQDLSQVLLAHPKVDVFVDVLFGAVCVDVKFLHDHLSTQFYDCDASGKSFSFMCLQCEGSLQFIQSLCQQKLFRERILGSKELCCKGGSLFLVLSTLKLYIKSPFTAHNVVDTVSRIKSKALSILLHLCEADSISYLDEVASYPKSLNLAKCVAIEILEILKTFVFGNSKCMMLEPEKKKQGGLLQLNAWRVADIFSDDSNFRSYITIYFTEFLTDIFLIPHENFLSSWCCNDLHMAEDDATIDFYPFSAAGWAIDFFRLTNTQSAMATEFSTTVSSMPYVSYGHQRTSLLVKVIANLHCFVPNICPEQERNLFLHKFVSCLQLEFSKPSYGFSYISNTQKSAVVCQNLYSLVGHAESLIPNFLNDDDIQLLRVFYEQLMTMISFVESDVNQIHGGGSGQVGSIFPGRVVVTTPTPIFKNDYSKEGIPENSSSQGAEHRLGEKRIDQAEDMACHTTMPHHKWGSCNTFSVYPKDWEKDGTIIETSGSDSSSARGKTPVYPPNLNALKSSNTAMIGGPHEKASNFGCMEKPEQQQRKKRKRTIMNEKQVALIEKALLEEPEMQRNAASVQSWADKLSAYTSGSEVTPSQLRNWLNNRKARLARAAKDERMRIEGGEPNISKPVIVKQVPPDAPLGSLYVAPHMPTVTAPDAVVEDSEVEAPCHTDEPLLPECPPLVHPAGYTDVERAEK